mgnify:CR=1 FL=1
MTPDLKLGLIGNHIARSRSPFLHRLAGEQNAMIVQYDRLIPNAMGEYFDTVFDRCVGRGYRGINVTYPYKELAAQKSDDRRSAGSGHRRREHSAV